MYHLKKFSSLALLTTFLVLLISPVAFANTISPNQSATVSGITYTFNSETVYENLIGEYTVAGKCNISMNKTAPTGYAGAQARLYTEDGLLYLSSTMSYNRVDCVGHQVYTNIVEEPGSYYSKSLCKFYNGNGYNSYNAYSSPVQTLYSNREQSNPLLVTAYNVNSSGETYGSDLSSFTIGESPDLISAIGTDGTLGYVRSSDLDPECNSISEALAVTSTSHFIPLYNQEGVVIGEFLVASL